MKWILSRNTFLEAKIGDLLNSKQAEKVRSKWGDKYLEYEEVDPTKKIIQGKWKLSEEDKNAVLGKFCETNISDLYDLFKNVPDKFATMINQSVGGATDKLGILFKDFDIQSPTLDQIVFLSSSVFRKISVSDTIATSVIAKDFNGVPIKDAENQMVRKEKNAGDIEFTRNLINLKSWISDYNSLIESAVDSKIKGWSNSDFVEDFSSNNGIRNLSNFYKDSNGNSEYEVDIEIFNRDIYLSINHDPKHILNMSISKFYSSCQHLYNGLYNEKVLGNVFDPNSIPAFLIFETPITLDGEIISDFLPLSRMVIRNIESFDDSDKVELFHDRAYPDRMRDIFREIVEKYSDNMDTYKGGTYTFSPDIDIDDDLQSIYSDHLDLERGKYIGKNTKTLYLSKIYDWSKVQINPNSKIKEVIIETSEIPANLTKVLKNVDWVKFRRVDIKSLKDFKDISINAIAFDKCRVSSEILYEVANSNTKSLKISNCDNLSQLDVSIFKTLEELHITYTLNDIDDIKNIKDSSIKKLVISGDIINKESKSKISEIKRLGIKVEITGPYIK